MVDRVFDRSGALYVKKIPRKGRGLFANTPFKAGDLIERCPTWVFDNREAGLIDLTGLLEYYFVRDGKDHKVDPIERHVVFGLASLVNHSFFPNAKTVWTDEISGAWASLVAIKEIKVDEEITQKYQNLSDYPKNINFVE
ncbi:SET domain-containing protein-lysine N-methyltransferase [Mesorhizobium sp. M0029]|uniref:SET domain-containing protein-lysine N-methyltransferase n=1 Tax=Mesorhizobium sp. M0029 TaxID=2956850 RepID=UPI003338FB7C